MEMAAFGPYIEKCEIDFSRFGESGLYLITGNTGSGKSTIFDAITYALFDDTSGSERKINMLINQFVNDASKTYVELDFLYAEKRYRIRRKPAYKVLKKRRRILPRGRRRISPRKKGRLIFMCTTRICRIMSHIKISTRSAKSIRQSGNFWGWIVSSLFKSR